MAISLSVLNVSSGFNLSNINTNFVAIQTALADALSLSGTAPNSMSAALDMGNNSIINANDISADTVTVAGVNFLTLASNLNPRGAWVTGTVYAVGDLVSGDGSTTTYVATVAHTAGTFSTDLNTNEYWMVFATPPNQNQVPEEFSGDAVTVSFNLSVAPAAEKDILVFIDGVFQAHTTYSVSGTAITFTEAPPTGTNNIVVWFSVPSQSLGAGDVVGPSTITDNTVARFDGTTGKLIQSSGIILTDTDTMHIPGTASAALPSLTFRTSDTDTGIYSGSSGSIDFSADSEHILRIQRQSTPVGGILNIGGRTDRVYISSGGTNNSIQIVQAGTGEVRLGNSTGQVNLEQFRSVRDFTVNGTILDGELCNLDSAGHMEKADANGATDPTSLLGVAMEIISNNNVGEFLLEGETDEISATAGTTYWVGTTAGSITSTKPTTTGDIQRIVGYGLEGGTFMFKPAASWTVAA